MYVVAGTGVSARGRVVSVVSDAIAASPFVGARGSTASGSTRGRDAAAPGRVSATPDQLALTYFGLGTVLLELGPFALLADPSPHGRGGRASSAGARRRPMCEQTIEIDRLPQFDAVIVSQLHGDHFDRSAKDGLTRRVPVLATRHAARRLRSWGFSSAGMDDGDTFRLSDVRGTVLVRSVPGSARASLAVVIDVEADLAGVPHSRHRLYLSSAIGSSAHLDEVRERFGYIDTAVVHLCDVRSQATIDSRWMSRIGQLVTQLEPRLIVPVHHSHKGVPASRLADFVMGCHRMGNVRVLVARPGQRLDLAANAQRG